MFWLTRNIPVYFQRKEEKSLYGFRFCKRNEPGKLNWEASQISSVHPSIILMRPFIHRPLYPANKPIQPRRVHRVWCSEMNTGASSCIFLRLELQTFGSHQVLRLTSLWGAFRYPNGLCTAKYEVPYICSLWNLKMTGLFQSVKFALAFQKNKNEPMIS